eukprot:TRINITY_DN2778_c0_g1_i1.p1 TRINITY_DN2778_c0_g1~~TRINITY_DN2778_c0_g1_i1.p1  ORF type:complete len:386 (+),score=59.41 TRINITY_DN2778_c0_g1_i1:590-1747(+)
MEIDSPFTTTTPAQLPSLSPMLNYAENPFATLPHTLVARLQLLSTTITKPFYECYIRRLAEKHSLTWHIDRLKLLYATSKEQTLRVDARFQIVAQVTERLNKIHEMENAENGSHHLNLVEVIKFGEQYEEYMRFFLSIMMILLQSTENLIGVLQRRRKEAKTISKEAKLAKVSIQDAIVETVSRSIFVLYGVQSPQPSHFSSGDSSPSTYSPPVAFYDSTTDEMLAEVTLRLSGGLNCSNSEEQKSSRLMSKPPLDCMNDEEYFVVLQNTNSIIHQILDFHFVHREPTMRNDEFNGELDDSSKISTHMAFWTDVERMRFQTFRKLFLQICRSTSNPISSGPDGATTPVVDWSELQDRDLVDKRRKRKAETELLTCQESFKKLCTL